MTTYIIFVNWTDQGIKNVRESPGRLDAAKKLLADMGGNFQQFYLTMGDYDMVAVCEAPDDAVMARMVLKLGQGGYIRTRTLKAFPENAYREIINSLG
ncbi:GYD domain-containing protein [Stappia sp. F7233]|uniref:GYD domain-containing protein n=1 Tax=Stappia albiluteola TaxID=2758565 RepID=A0A839AFT1_9HYPH|nr:GYD domain-containing protein [Stappia albiluteola]MBA5777878.1 GYD domain-containing protein [Stappia albiluteola]